MINVELYKSAAELLNNQPNGAVIGCSTEDNPNVLSTLFHHLSRKQQVQEIVKMVENGVNLIELQIELYLVAHKLVPAVWRDFGLL